MWCYEFNILFFMRVVIIEDEPLAASRLKMIISEYDPAIEIVAVLESVEDAVHYFQQHVLPDLVLLDIELADGISFSIFSRVKVDCPVIFITAYDKYAIDAFRLFSIDYLLKPVTQEALSRALHKYRTLAGFSLIYRANIIGNPVNPTARKIIPAKISY